MRCPGGARRTRGPLRENCAEEAALARPEAGLKAAWEPVEARRGSCVLSYSPRGGGLPLRPVHPSHSCCFISGGDCGLSS